ncbi:MAG: hypothetical protein AAF399_11775 [Bacteroidota bacterium]
MGKNREFLLLIGGTLGLLLLSGWVVPIIDQWEIPVAEVSREMMVSKHWFQPQLGFESIEVPLLLQFFWQAGCFHLVDVHAWALRIPTYLLLVAIGISIATISRNRLRPGSLTLAGLASLPLLLAGVIGWPYLGFLLSFLWMGIQLHRMEIREDASKREGAAYLAGILLGISALQLQVGVLWIGWAVYIGLKVLHASFPKNWGNLLRFVAGSLILCFPFQLLPALLSPEAAPLHWWEPFQLQPIWNSPPEMGRQFLWTILLLGVGLPWHRLQTSSGSPKHLLAKSVLLVSLLGGGLLCLLKIPLGSWLPIWPLPGMICWFHLRSQSSDHKPLPSRIRWFLGGCQSLCILTACGWLSHSGAPKIIWLVGAGFLLWQVLMFRQTQQHAFSFPLLETGVPLGIAGLLIAWVFPLWAQQSDQAAPSYFFSQLPAQQTYVLSEGYPSYLPHFLAQSLPPTQAGSEWLTAGEVDREVFVIADSLHYQTTDFQRQYLDFETLYQQDGFVFLRRKRKEVPRLSLHTSSTPKQELCP